MRDNLTKGERYAAIGYTLALRYAVSIVVIHWMR